MPLLTPYPLPPTTCMFYLTTYRLPLTRYRCSLYSHMVPANAEGAQQGTDVPPPVGLTEQQAAPALLTLPWPQP